VLGLFYSPEISLGDRLTVSADSLRIFRDHPWLGTGLGSFEAVFPEYQSFPSDLRYDHAHDEYAEALTETGLVGGALIVLALGLFFRNAFRNLNERLENEAGWIQMGAVLGCCGLLVHSFVDFNLHIPANAMWFALSFGIATSFSERSRPGSQSPPG
jgi:O-antigen ligase